METHWTEHLLVCRRALEWADLGRLPLVDALSMIQNSHRGLSRREQFDARSPRKSVNAFDTE